jgi:3-oxoacyl-[acyl-carrier-protein] synthase III
MPTFEYSLPIAKTNNVQLEEQLALPSGWIAQRTGIHERRHHIGGVSDLAIEAALKCLAAEKIEATSIDTVLMATVTPDNPWPATACKVAHAIGAHRAWAMDISAACSGFVYSLQLIKSLLASGQSKCILLLTGDCMSSIVDPQDRNTSILFGDACVASIWRAEQAAEIIDVQLGCDGSGYYDIVVRHAGSANRDNGLNSPALHLEGGRVFRAAVSRMSESIQHILLKNQKTIADIQWFIPHQANLRIIEAIASTLELPNDKILSNVQLRGNTTNASIPLCWAEHQQCIQSNDLVLVTSFGAGFTYGSALLQPHF